MKIRFRRLAALLLCLALLLPLAACSEYREEMSNGRQSRVIATLDGQEVRFELIEFFYHNYQTEAVAAGADEATRHAWLSARIADAVGDLYGIFALARDYGIDPFGDTVQKTMDERVKELIDSYPDRRTYIETITEAHMSDAVCRLLLRAEICRTMLLSRTGGISAASDADLTTFANDPDVFCALSLSVNRQGSDAIADAWFNERAAAVRAALSDVTSDEDFVQAVVRYDNTFPNRIEHGTYLTLRQYRNLVSDPAARPAVGDMTEPLYSGNGLLVMRVKEKEPAYVLERTEAVMLSYLEYLTERKAVPLAAAFAAAPDFTALTPEDFA